MNAPASVAITTYGVLHGPAPEGNALTVDLRTALRNPHHDPAMRHLTGLDEPVRDHVLATLFAGRIVAETVASARAVLNHCPAYYTEPLLLHVFCQGGRHRSVAIAEAVADGLRACGVSVQVTHRDITKPVVQAVAA